MTSYYVNKDKVETIWDETNQLVYTYVKEKKPENVILYVEKIRGDSTTVLAEGLTATKLFVAILNEKRASDRVIAV
jgi:hypothetical protein